MYREKEIYCKGLSRMIMVSPKSILEASTTSDSLRWLPSKPLYPNPKKTSVDEDNNPYVPFGGIKKKVIVTVKTSMAVPKTIKNRIIIWSRISTGYILKMIESRISKKYLYIMLLAALFSIAKMWSYPSAHWWMNRKAKCDVYIWWNSIQPLKGRQFWRMLQYK